MLDRKPVTEAEKLAQFRRDTVRHTSSPSTLPIKLCSRCGKSKNVTGGRQRTAIHGKITRWNPLIFVCAQCVGEEQ